MNKILKKKFKRLLLFFPIQAMSIHIQRVHCTINNLNSLIKYLEHEVDLSLLVLSTSPHWKTPALFQFFISFLPETGLE